jgi:hypothetical protein
MMLGYDQGVMSALLTAPQVRTAHKIQSPDFSDAQPPINTQFEKVFPQVKGGGNHATLQSFVVAIYVRSSYQPSAPPL